MKPEVYAKAMFTLSASGKTAEFVVSGAIKSLKARGAIRLLPKILSSYERLMADALSKGSVLTVAREADTAGVMKESGAGTTTKVVVDANIIGGYRLESDGRLADNSFKSHLLQVYRNATAA